MRENCTYGLTRGRAYPARGALLYSTKIDTVAEFWDNVRMRKNRVIECVLYRDASLLQVVATWNRLKTEEQELFKWDMSAQWQIRSRQCRTLREAVGIRSRIHFSRYYMTSLIGKVLVARTNSGNPMSHRQKYKLS